MSTLRDPNIMHAREFPLTEPQSLIRKQCQRVETLLQRGL